MHISQRLTLLCPLVLLTAAVACSSSSDSSAPPVAHAGATSGGAGAPSAGSPNQTAGSSAGGATGTAGAATAGAATAGSSPAGAGGAIGSAGAAGATTGAAGAAGSGTAGGTGSSACPADATFCSGFEDTALPTGAVYKANAAPGDWSQDFAVDTTLFHSGKSALRVKSGDEAGVSSSAYRMLAVPTPTTAFWVRFYIQQTDRDLGGMDHNEFAAAAASDDPNSSPRIEFAEDVGIAFNTSDTDRWPTDYGRLTSGGTKPFTLPKGMWHCIEISFDAAGREQKLFINGTQQIDATDYPKAGSVSAIKNFRFGFFSVHGPNRKVWYDDVVVAPNRIPCF